MTADRVYATVEDWVNVDGESIAELHGMTPGDRVEVVGFVYGALGLDAVVVDHAGYRQVPARILTPAREVAA